MRQAVWLAAGTASALGLARFAYGLLLPAMRDDLGWSLTQAGVMSAANGLGYLVGALVTAALVRRVGSAAAFRWSMVLTSVALAVTAVSSHYPALLAARAAAGVTGAVVFITGGVIASRIATRASSGAPLVVYFAGTGLGIVLSGATVPALGTHWRIAWVGMGLAAGLATLVSWTAASPDGEESSATAGRARLRPLRRVLLAYLLFATGYITYITFLSAYLAERHAPLTQVTLIWTALGTAVVAAPALWSRPITHWRGGTALASLLVLLAGGAALALVSPALPLVLASAIVYGATFMSVPAAVTALVKAGTPPADWTATLAAFTTVFAVGQTAGPWIAGILADHTSTDATLAWTAILCAAAAVIAATAGRHRPPASPATNAPNRHLRPPARRPSPATRQGERQ
ncbi:Predicted arabinose efflux permease, MFS family [Nonomuraea maritima]|uniref:Predicted arabinose efflux permease, MFS family n=1 Tax=Nonomuraea maritima TaxID=683260 RepID=A0A1G9S5J7_9ACTN|nr:YbfB/YjiJ family MFS transporter [Nonomuraea maritima]SDM30779.1 Predicted arabinose efflux permease, MFS family [Nonomuraea maritima]